MQIQSSNLYRYWGDIQPQEVPEGSGSGFVWDEEGHVVTNLHVVRGGTRLSGEPAGRATPISRSSWGRRPTTTWPCSGWTFSSEKLRPLPIGSSSDLRVGQSSFAIGYPFRQDQTLTTGVISGLDRSITSQSGLPIYGVIQTDAAINPGNSGGPLLDSSGRLIGINTAIASATGANTGVGFAVPVDTANRIIPRILNEGSVQRAGLGISVGDDLYASGAGLQGAVVQSVIPTGPAGRAGLIGLRQTEAGDILLGDVIVGIDDQEIRRQADLFQALEVYRSGETIRVRVNRASREGRTEEDLRVRLAPLR